MSQLTEFAPKTSCWAYSNGTCQILKDCYCKKEKECHHYQTEVQRNRVLRKCRLRLQNLDLSKKALESEVKTNE